MISMQYGKTPSDKRNPTVAGLWQNADPSSSFSAQTVTLSDSAKHYDFLWVTFLFSTSTQTMTSGMFLVADLIDNQYEAALRINAGSANRTGARTFTMTNDVSVVFASASYNGSTSNSSVIPAAIYGIKL